MMVTTDETRNAEVEIRAELARKDFTRLLQRAGFGAERFVVTHFGKPCVAVVSMADLERLRALDAA